METLYNDIKEIANYIYALKNPELSIETFQ